MQGALLIGPQMQQGAEVGLLGAAALGRGLGLGHACDAKSAGESGDGKKTVGSGHSHDSTSDT